MILEGFNLEDRFTIGLIAGLNGAIAMDAVDFLSYFTHFDRSLLLNFASSILYAHKPTFWLEYILTELAHIIFACGLAIIFVYLLPIINIRKYLLKGAFWGGISWFVIYTTAIIYKMPGLAKIPWQAATDNLFDSIV